MIKLIAMAIAVLAFSSSSGGGGTRDECTRRWWRPRRNEAYQ